MMTCCCCCGHNQLQRLAARVTVATAQGAFDRHAALANFELESRQQFLATLNAFEDKSVCNIHSNLWVPNNIFPSLIAQLFNFIKTMLAAYRLLAIKFVWNVASGYDFRVRSEITIDNIDTFACSVADILRNEGRITVEALRASGTLVVDCLRRELRARNHRLMHHYKVRFKHKLSSACNNNNLLLLWSQVMFAGSRGSSHPRQVPTNNRTNSSGARPQNHRRLHRYRHECRSSRTSSWHHHLWDLSGCSDTLPSTTNK